MMFSKATYDYMIVGLGNPGSQYEKTRHNAGFMALDAFLQNKSCGTLKNKHQAQFCEVKLKDARILCVKPQTYMNNSGSAVRDIAAFYKIPTEKIIVMFDDISLEVGKIRIRRKGSAGGHNGIKDIIALLGSEDIMRIKIGVGSKPHPDYDLKDWVLGRFNESEKAELSEALKSAAAALEEIISRGIDSAMNKYSK